MKNLSDDLHIPEFTPSLLRAAGHFMFAWGIVERELDTAFPVLFHTDPTLACCLYANLGTKNKIEILLSATEMMSTKLGGHLAATAKITLNKISALSGDARNTLAHGQPLVLGETGMDGRWELVRHAARASHKIVVHPRSARYWTAQTATAIRLARKWRTCVAKINRKVGHLTLDQLEQICTTQIRASPSNPRDRQKNLPPGKHDFGGRRATLAKWPRT